MIGFILPNYTHDRLDLHKIGLGGTDNNESVQDLPGFDRTNLGYL